MNRTMDGEDSGDILKGFIRSSRSSNELESLNDPREGRLFSSEDRDIISTKSRESINGDSQSFVDDEEKQETDSDSENEWDKELDNVEIIDDPVRMYLREIGRVRLLKAVEERSLARKMEASKYLRTLEQGFASINDRPLRAFNYYHQMLKGACHAQTLIDALCRY